MSTGEERLQWRRNKVLELSSQGRSQPQIARILQVGLGTVNRDLQHLRQEAKENIKRYINEKLPEEYEKTLYGLNSILREAWALSQANDTGKTEKIKASSLAKDYYSMKLDLLTNATVVDYAIRFVQSNSYASGYSHINEAESTIKDIQTIRKKKINRLPLKSDTEPITVNKVF